MQSVKRQECKFCERTFARSYNLSRHLQEVHNRHLETENSENSNDENSKASDSDSKDDTESEGSRSSRNGIHI